MLDGHSIVPSTSSVGLAMPRPDALVIPPPDHSIWIRSALFDHGILGLPIRRRPGNPASKDLIATNFASMASALVDISEGKDWTETAKTVRASY